MVAVSPPHTTAVAPAAPLTLPGCAPHRDAMMDSTAAVCSPVIGETPATTLNASASGTIDSDPVRPASRSVTEDDHCDVDTSLDCVSVLSASVGGSVLNGVWRAFSAGLGNEVLLLDVVVSSFAAFARARSRSRVGGTRADLKRRPRLLALAASCRLLVGWLVEAPLCTPFPELPAAGRSEGVSAIWTLYCV